MGAKMLVRGSTRVGINVTVGPLVRAFSSDAVREGSNLAIAQFFAPTSRLVNSKHLNN